MVRLLGTGREGYRTNRPPSSCATLVAWPRNHGLLTPPVPIYIRPRSSVSHRCSLLPPILFAQDHGPLVTSRLCILPIPPYRLSPARRLTLHTVPSLLWQYCSTLDAHPWYDGIDESSNILAENISVRIWIDELIERSNPKIIFLLSSLAQDKIG